MLRAEGFLCRGLEDDDPWALETAIDAFQQRLATDATDFFAQLYLAEALRRRYSLAETVVPAFTRAAELLDRADVGAARVELIAYVGDSLATVRANRERLLPLLRERQSDLARGRLVSRQLEELLTLLAQTGPGGVDLALDALERQLARSYDPALDTFQRAELLRGRRAPAVVAALYEAATRMLCPHQQQMFSSECSRARRRFDQLHAARVQEGGSP